MKCETRIDFLSDVFAVVAFAVFEILCWLRFSFLEVNFG